MKKNHCKSSLFIAFLFTIAIFTFSCGGGGGGGEDGGSINPLPVIVSGVVQAPGGQVAFYRQQNPLERFANLVTPFAYAAVSGLSPVPDGTLVQLGRMTSGGIMSVLATTSTSGGRYSFDIARVGLAFASDLIVQVANPTTGARMRAFVTGMSVNITPMSESAIQLVLELIASTPGISLNNFTLQEISDLIGAIDAMTSSNQVSAGVNINSTVSSVKNAVTSDPNIVAFLTSVSEPGQTSEGPGDVGNYMPLTQGNTYTYQGTEQTAGQTPSIYSNTATISGTKLVGGILTTVVSQTNPLNIGSPEEDYYTKDSRGITFHGNNDPTDVLTTQLVPYLSNRFPLGTGSTFVEIDRKGLNLGQDLDGDGQSEKTDLLSIVTMKGFENVTVPAGSFYNCAKVETQTTFFVIASSNGARASVQGTQTIWYAPGVGPVKLVLQIADQTVTEELTSFTNLKVNIINLNANSDLIFDSVSQKIYASVRGNPGNITPIDPVTRNLGPAIPVGIDPVKLARSDNGQFLYVGLDGENSVQRIDLLTQTVDLSFALGSDSFSGPYYVEDIEVLPGNPQAVAISRRYKGSSPRHAGVAIFDNNIQRSKVTPGHTGSNVIEFSASSGTLYGYNNETTEFGFRRMAVDASGVTILDVFTDLIFSIVDIKFNGGLIYTTNGRVIDPVASTIVGTFSLPVNSGHHQFCPDATIGRVFYLTSELGTWSIRAFDLNTLQLLRSVNIPGVSGDPSSLIRWGAKGLAFRTSSGQIFLIESSNLIP